MPDFPKPTKKFEKLDDYSAATLTELVEAYRGSIDMLRAALSKEIEAHKLVEKADPNFGDDIYLLRFIIMNFKKGFDKVKKYLKQTMEWRAQHAALLASYRAGEAPIHDADFRPFMIGGFHYRNKDGHLVNVMRNGLGNADGVLQKLKPKDVTDYIVHSKEALFAICDTESRKRNKFVFMVGVLDFNHATMATMGSSKFRDAATDATKESETYYPMLVGKSIIFNMPTVISAIMKMALLVMPKSMQEKMLICSEDTVEGRLAFAEKHLSLGKADIPTFLGGSCDCEGGCCLGVPNTQAKQLSEEDARRELPKWSEILARMEPRAVL